MTVSVLIPARDAAATLLETLNSIAAQTAPAAEVILVDDASTDATSELAAAHQLPIRLITGAGSGPAAATNLAAQSASSEWLPPQTAMISGLPTAWQSPWQPPPRAGLTP